MNTEIINILLVDDHQIVVDGLLALLKDVSIFKVIGTANNGHDALEKIEILKPDVVLMDIDMPIMNGIVAAKNAKKNFPHTKIIILSLHFEKAIIKKMMEMNIEGYLLKNSDSKELINAIEMVGRGKKYFSGDVTLTLLHSDKDQRPPIITANLSERLSLLSNREIEVLKAIAEGYSSREIAEQLFISHRTVDTHRTNIMKKLMIKKLAGLIKFAFQAGLLR